MYELFFLNLPFLYLLTALLSFILRQLIHSLAFSFCPFNGLQYCNDIILLCLGLNFSLNTLNSLACTCFAFFFFLMMQHLYEFETLMAWPAQYYLNLSTFLCILIIGHENVLYFYFRIAWFLVPCGFPVKCWLPQCWIVQSWCYIYWSGIVDWIIWFFNSHYYCLHCYLFHTLFSCHSFFSWDCLVWVCLFTIS